MKLSWNWLKELVEVPASPEEVAERLTMAGLEVEALERVGSDLQGIVVGQILRLDPHPETERLSLLEVDVESERLPIISGAANIKVGDRVPVALPGSSLPDGRRIEVAEIKGVTSYGMLCSEAELKLGEDQSGIMILPEDLSIGRPLAEALELQDVVLEVAVTPNRGDCLSHLGIAREIAALFGRKLHLPRITVKEKGPPVETLASVEILDPDLCPRYAARIVLDVAIKRSPFWLRRRLSLLGLRPINNVVDATNYVMLERGQPLHAFDYEQLRGRRIVVRRARVGERIVTLDGVERILSEGMLVIADQEAPVAIAGVMGGGESEVKGVTQAVLLESAYFDPLSVRRTAKALGLSTEASFRFERGVDPGGIVKALDRVTQLIAVLSGGKVAQGAILSGAKDLLKAAPRRISLRVSRLNALLGVDIPREEAASILRRLGLKLQSRGQDVVLASVPSFRGDLEREIDLIEEVARIWGFERIPIALPKGRLKPSPLLPTLRAERKAKRIMVSEGYWEAVTFSFTRGEAFDTLRLGQDDPLRKAVKLLNPISEEGSYLRTSLLPGLLRSLALNESRGVRRAKLFEIGRTFHPKGEGVLPEERLRLAALAYGLREEPSWKGGKEGVDFYDLKGTLEALAQGFGVSFTFEAGAVPYLHPSRQATVHGDGMFLGVIGQIHRETAEGFGLTALPYGFEIDLDALIRLERAGRRFIPLPRFPAAQRDVAVLVREEEEAGRIQRLISSWGEELVEKVVVFDVYRGEGIPEGYKSLAFSISYRSPQRTLTDEEVNAVHGQILRRLQEELGATIR